MSYCYCLQVGQMPCCACSRCRNGQFDYILMLMSLVGWLVVFGFNGPLRQYFSLYRAVSQRKGERGEKG